MTLITPTQLLPSADRTGRVYALQVAAIDYANLNAAMIQPELATAFISGTPQDIGQFSSWIVYARGIVTSSSASLSASGTPSNGGLGGFGVGGGSFGAGNGALSRDVEFQSQLFSWFNGIRQLLRSYASTDIANGVNAWNSATAYTAGQIALYSGVNYVCITGNTNAVPSANPADWTALSAIVDLNTYAAYWNAQTAYQCLFTPDFASAFYYANSGGPQLNPACVLAPAGIVLGHFAITAANTGTLSNNASTNWPAANGYATPVPTNTGGTGTTDREAWSSATAYNALDVVSYGGAYYVAVASSTNVTPGTNPAKWVVNTFGNNVFLGNMPMAQAFAPIKTPACSITTNINGTCAATITAKNQAGSTENWTATLDNATAGTIINLSPAVTGDRMNSAITAVSISGTATAGAFDIVTTYERTV